MTSNNELIFEVAEFLKNKFNFVYVHNIFDDKAKDMRKTVCPDCKSVIATREPFKLEVKSNFMCEKCNNIFVV